jgi:hypothetical protein
LGGESGKGGVQVLYQADQVGAVKVGQLGVDIAPIGRVFLKCYGRYS